MPVYRYKCKKCGRVTEVRQEFSKYQQLTVCGKPTVRLNKYEMDVCRGMLERIYDDFQFHISGR